MNPLIGASLIAGGASLIGGTSANETNERIAGRQNALNYKMFQQQNRFNVDMWHKQNAYNDPKAQLERYKSAGINPFFALGNVTGGNAQGVTSASPAPAVGYQYQDPIGPAINTAVNTYVSDMTAQKLRAERDLTVELAIEKNKQNLRQDEIIQTGLDNTKADTNLKKSNAGLNSKYAELAEANIKRLKDLTPLEKDRLSAEIESIKANVDLAKTTQALKKFELDKEAPARVNHYIAMAYKAYKDGDLSAGMVSKVVAETEFLNAQAIGVNWSNEEKREFHVNLKNRVKLLDDKLSKEIELADKQAGKAGADADYSRHKRVYDWFKLYTDFFVGVQGNAAKAVGSILKK